MRVVTLTRAPRCPRPGLFLASFCALLIGFVSPGRAQQLAWQAPVLNAQTFAVQPDGSAFVVDAAGLFHLFTPEGATRATLSLGSGVVGGIVPVGASDYLVVTVEGRLIRIDANGAKLWDVALNAVPTGTPAVANDAAYVAAGNLLIARSLSDGAPLWAFDAERTVTGSPGASAQGVGFATSDGQVWQLDLAGKMRYSLFTGDIVPVMVSMSSTGGMIYTGKNTIGATITAGDYAWEVTFSDPALPFASAKAVMDNGVTYLAAGSVLQSLKADGTPGWSYDAGGGATLTAPLLLTTDHRLVASLSDGRILVLTTDGAKVSEFRLATTPLGAAALTSGRYFALIGAGGVGAGGSDLLAAYIPNDPTPPLWKPSGLDGTPVLALAHHPAQPHLFLAGGDGFVATSTDDGRTWSRQAIQALKGDSVVRYVAVAADGAMLAATQSELYSRPAGASSFDFALRQEDMGPVAFDPNASTRAAYSNALDQFFYITSPIGETEAQQDLPTLLKGLLWLPDGSQVADTDTSILRRATSTGVWASVADGLILDVTSSADGRRLFAGGVTASGGARLFSSADGGATFTDLGAKQLVGGVYRVAMNASSPNELVAGTILGASRPSPGGARGVNAYRSVDSGATWAVLDKGLRDVNPHALAGGDGFFLMGTNTGVSRLDLSNTPPPVKKGDLNDDGTVNVLDAILALRITAGLVTATPRQLLAGDVAPAAAPDGKINVADAIRILRAVAGLEAL